MSTSIEQLIAVLDDTGELLKKSQVNLKKCPKQRLTRGYVQTRIQCIEEYWDTLKKAHQELTKITNREQRKKLQYFVQEEFYEHEDLYLNLIGDLKDMLNVCDSRSEGAQKGTPLSSQSNSQVKLERISIPNFSGNYEEFNAYKDLFTSLIHNNTSLSKVQKLHYLKTSLTGEAAALLRHIQVTDSNYEQAWTLLKQRYGNKKIIVNTLLKRLFAQKKCTSQTATQLKLILDTTTEVMNSLENLEVSTASWDPLIIFLVVQKLDTDSHKEWEEFAFTQSGDELPTWEHLKKFLEAKFRTIELVTPSSASREKTIKERVFHVTTTEKICMMCKENHTLCHCKLFTAMQPSERSQYVLNNKLCYNCLTPGHQSFKCRMPMSCRICKRRHHTLLHQPRKTDESISIKEPNQSTSSIQADVEEKQVHTSIASNHETEHKVSLLATAVVILKGENGHATVLKALIDSGSQASFISEKAAQALKLERKQVNLIVTGMDSMKVRVRQSVEIRILSRWEPDFEMTLRAFVMSGHLTTNIPLEAKPMSEWPHLQNLNLADPNYYESGSMDLLLGVDEYSTILQQGLIKGPPGTPCAQRTNLGWIIMGGTHTKYNMREKSLSVITQEEANINDLLKTIWEIDIDAKRKFTKDEQLCEDIYEKTHARNKEGRYIVTLPVKTENPISPKGNTREAALKRFMQLERRFNKNTQLKEDYTKVIEEYKEMKHMEEVPEREIKNNSVYLPHHAVIREDKETTRTRVVFDASCCDARTGISLNDELLTGPILQEDLRSIIMRWRSHAVCFVADIEKMYRMILMHKNHADYQRILWRSDPSEPVKDYRLLTVTFGTASAPYLAVKTLMQLAEDESVNYPEAAKIMRDDFYIDDLMSGCDSLPKAIQVSRDLRELLRRGGFELKKWSSNSAEFMQSVESNARSSNAHIELKVDGIVKALGIQWNLGNDQFEYNLNLPPVNYTITKRSILSDIQKLFDPLGWIAPCIVMVKILIQKLWLEKVTWDEDISLLIKDEWITIRNDLTHIEDVKIDRWLGTFNATKDMIQIHGFSDASILAYAAVVYCRVTNQEGSHKTSLVAARTRVAPLKTVSLPRLELCGALLLSRLLKHVAQAMRIPTSQVFAWTDSSIVLSWLFGHPTRWKPFVANRVVEITSNLNNSQWHHVESQCNPADIASRGMLVRDLIKCELWWKGPEWLSVGEIQFTRPNNIPTDLELRKKNVQTLALTQCEETIEPRIEERFEDFTTFSELLRAISYCKRFLNFKKIKENIDAKITTKELEDSMKTCMKIAQKNEFSEEIEALSTHKNVKNTSKLRSLNPFLDEDNILRVGGRLRMASTIDYEGKHPIILSKDSKLTPLLVAEAHTKTMHGGIQLMLCYLRSKYWILRAKGLVRQYIHRCLICARHSASPRTQIMGDLPKIRVTPARPFLNSGVDFMGPVQILRSKGRGSKTVKAYVAIFICASVKALHLEIVSDMTAQGFINAFKRFCARRGKCAHLWSDQGRNFVGANKELIDAWKEASLQFDSEISDTLANDGTQWHFIPAYSPNFGGLWESAGVKSTKFHLKRILSGTHLTFEEMSTVLCEIEACLNSRPLAPIDPDDESMQPLTPGHFLIGEAPITVPSPSLRTVNVSHLTRWQHCQKLLNDFWCRWHKEYLSRLQQRPKWQKRVEEFKNGEIVLIKQDNLPPGKWVLGRIVDKHVGPDGNVRVYSVKSGSNVVKRCVSKLCPLPIETD